MTIRAKTLKTALAGLLVLPFLVAAGNAGDGPGKGGAPAGGEPSDGVAVAASIRGVEVAQWANTRGAWRQASLNAQFAAYREGQAVPYRLVLEATTAGHVDVTISYARALGSGPRQANGFSDLSAPDGVDPCADQGVTCAPHGDSAFLVGGATLSVGASERVVLNNGVDDTRQVRLHVAAPGTVVLAWAGELASTGPGPDGVTVLPGAGSVAGASLHMNVGVGGGLKPLQVNPDAIAVLDPEPVVEPCTGPLTVAVVDGEGAAVPGATVTIAGEVAETGTSTLDCGDVAVALTALPEGYELADAAATLPLSRTVAVDAAGATTTFVLAPTPAAPLVPDPETIVAPCTGPLTVAVVDGEGASVPGATVTIAGEVAETGTSTLDCGDVAVALTALPEGYELADAAATLPLSRTVAVDAAGATTMFVLAPIPAPAPIVPAPAPEPVVEACTGDLTVDVLAIDGAPVPGATIAIAGERIVLDTQARRSLGCGDVTVELLDLPAGYRLATSTDGGEVGAASLGTSVLAAPDVVMAARIAKVHADAASAVVFEVERTAAPAPDAPRTPDEEARSETPTPAVTPLPPVAPAPQPRETTAVSGDGQERAPLAAPIPAETVQAPARAEEPVPAAAPASEATLDEDAVLPVTGADGSSLVVLGALLLLAGTLVASGERRARARA